MKIKTSNFLKTLGPGILFASTAIGASHLVISTRAGAYFSFGMLGLIVLINILKYPLFEFGSRYTAATGKSIIEGYRNRSKTMLIAYTVLVFSTMFTVSAALIAITAGLLINIVSTTISMPIMAGMLIVFCLIILLIGKYGLFDTSLKTVTLLLFISTIAVFFVTMSDGPESAVDWSLDIASAPQKFTIILVGLLGWMPTAVEASSWSGLWAIERNKQTGYTPSLKEALFEFNFGYLLTAIMALLFVFIGAYTIYGTDIVLSDKSPVFMNQFISIYTSKMGDCSYYIIAISALSGLLGTTITAMDAFTRVTVENTRLLFFEDKSFNKDIYYKGILIAIGLVAFIILNFFISSFTALLYLATAISFLTAPFTGFFNYKAVTSNDLNAESQPKSFLRILSICGIVFLAGFGMYYVYLLIT